jgi:V8-like Glu-specific endopeptidase
MKRNPLNLQRFVLACLLLSLGGAALTVHAKQKAAEPPNASFDHEQALAQRRELNEWLKSEAVAGGMDRPIRVSLTAAEMLEIDQARGELPERVGLARELARDISFADVDLRAMKGRILARPNGALQATADGGFVYTAAIASPEAIGLRIHFNNFQLPDNAGVYLYTEDGQVFGPYTGRGPHGDGDFWSHTVMGDEVRVQLRYLGQASDADLRGTSLRIAGLGHLRPRFLAGPCSYNAECIVNLACATGVASAVDVAELAVAHMQWIQGPYLYMCSGGLLADTDDSTEIPWFLSANHCISRDKDAKNLETFFLLTSDQCETSCDDVFDTRASHPQQLRVLGATVRASNRSSDYTLFQLNGPAPVGTAFLGWDSSPVASSNGAGLFRISHPSGAPQSYSEHLVDTSKTTCSSWPRGNWIYSRDTYGATEGGSSGSPVVNAAGQVVGQLSGGCGFNVNDVCDANSNATVDGAFAAYFDQVAQLLAPDTSCTPSPEVCNDGIDNNCDGVVDEGCGGGEGLPAGSLCDSGSQCASGKCTGKPGAKICR